MTIATITLSFYFLMHNIIINKQWNFELRKGLLSALMARVMVFRTSWPDKWSWLRYLRRGVLSDETEGWQLAVYAPGVPTYLHLGLGQWNISKISDKMHTYNFTVSGFTSIIPRLNLVKSAISQKWFYCVFSLEMTSLGYILLLR